VNTTISPYYFYQLFEEYYHRSGQHSPFDYLPQKKSASAFSLVMKERIGQTVCVAILPICGGILPTFFGIVPPPLRNTSNFHCISPNFREYYHLSLYFSQLFEEYYHRSGQHSPFDYLPQKKSASAFSLVMKERIGQTVCVAILPTCGGILPTFFGIVPPSLRNTTNFHCISPNFREYYQLSLFFSQLFEEYCHRSGQMALNVKKNCQMYYRYFQKIGKRAHIFLQ
jgi:hypothetical protein